jgi:hypothetical protein
LFEALLFNGDVWLKLEGFDGKIMYTVGILQRVVGIIFDCFYNLEETREMITCESVC